MQGRLINGKYVVDDLFVRLAKWVNETFDTFFDNECEEDEPTIEGAKLF